MAVSFLKQKWNKKEFLHIQWYSRLHGLALEKVYSYQISRPLPLVLELLWTMPQVSTQPTTVGTILFHHVCMKNKNLMWISRSNMLDACWSTVHPNVFDI